MLKEISAEDFLCVQATSSFLGVGAPEALLVGVVALVVFGPKGLADVRFVKLMCYCLLG